MVANPHRVWLIGMRARHGISGSEWDAKSHYARAMLSVAAAIEVDEVAREHRIDPTKMTDEEATWVYLALIDDERHAG